MKKTMTRILLLVAAMVLALSVPAFAEEAEAVSTTAYIFWQDQDWWPAASSNTDDYWTPTPATVTGEGWYTVKVDAHMPSWFYPDNSNIGAQKLAVVVKDGNDLFPGLYMQIVDVRIDGVSYPCGDVTYGQTGYENKADDGTVFWDANDTYALLYDQWMIDNAGTVGTGATWNSAAAAQKFDVFDVSALNNPKSIEIDFFLSAKQDVKPEGGPDLRVLSEGPQALGKYVALADLVTVPDNATTAHLYYQGNGWWPTINQQGVAPEVTIKGEGEYTASASFVDQGGWVPSGNGAEKFLLIVTDGGLENGQPTGTVMDGMLLGVTDVRINGESIKVGNVAYGPTGYDLDGLFDANDGYAILYDKWMQENQAGQLPWGHKTWNGTDGSTGAVNPDDLKNVVNLEVDFVVTGTAGKIPEPPVVKYEYAWYPNNTMSVVGYSLRDLGITDKWYHAVPVDLTKNGIYKIPMIAGNMFVIGDAIVSVQDGEVTVEYETIVPQSDNLAVTSECVKWFADIADITDEFCDNPQSDLAFGDTISTAELGNVGYLFICNRVDFSLPANNFGFYLPRFYENSPEWVSYRLGLDALVASLPEVVPSPEAVASPEAPASPEAGAVASPEAPASPDAGAVPSPEA